MEPILLQTSEADAGTRLDACLARAIEDLTRSAAAKAVEDGRVLVNGKAPNKSYKLTGHEQIEFTPCERFYLYNRRYRCPYSLYTQKWYNPFRYK